MSGIVTRLYEERRSGLILGEDGITYYFQESSLRNSTFNMLRVGHDVTSFEDNHTALGLVAEDIYVSGM